MFNLKNAINKKRTSLAIMLVYNGVNLFIAFLFYPLIPFMLCYPPGTINNKFDSDVAGVTYNVQYIFAVVFIMFIGFLIMNRLFSGVDKWKDAYLDNSEEGFERLSKIRKKCINYPNFIYIFQIIVLVLIIILVMLVTKHLSILIFKMLILVTSFVTFADLISLIFSKRIFTPILISTYKGQALEGLRVGLGSKIVINILPMVVVAVMFTSLLGYSRLIQEKGDLVSNYYNIQLSNIFSKDKYIPNEDYFFNKVKYMTDAGVGKSSKESSFVVYSKDRIITSDGGELSSFFLKYLFELSEKYNNRVYDYYGIDIQGVAIKVKSPQGDCYVGVKYEVVSIYTLTLFIIAFLLLVGFTIIVLWYFANSIAQDIARVTENLTELAEGDNVDFDKRLAVTSNDELGDLIVAFNKIQQREKESITKLKDNQLILLEQERLASLGQLIGGIAHNLKTPIMSISGGIEALMDLTREYDNSIEDDTVDNSDHHEIASEMKEWLEKMKPYCSYMSDIISAVKGQAVQMIASSSSKFTVDELVKRVDLLMKHELKKYHCDFNKDFKINMNTEIKGEINNLVQVFDNIIMNSVQAYEGKDGIIDFIIERKNDSIEFMFRDYAKGIPANIADKLFKEMITTKGKNGTGLGLYISYATIKGRFGGNMAFTSREGSGTAFEISIPCITYNKEAVI